MHDALMNGETTRVLESSSRRCRSSDGDYRWHVFVKVRVAVSREARHGYRGQRVGKPVIRTSATFEETCRRAERTLATQSTVVDSDYDMPLVHVSPPHHEVTSVVVPVRAPESHGPRARSELSDLGHLTLIDSSDEDAPFVVPTRPVVPEPEDTPQSFHLTISQAEHTCSIHQGPSREGEDVAARVGPQLSVDPTHVDSNSGQVDESFLDALENDLQVQEEGPSCE